MISQQGSDTDVKFKYFSGNVFWPKLNDVNNNTIYSGFASSHGYFAVHKIHVSRLKS